MHNGEKYRNRNTENAQAGEVGTGWVSGSLGEALTDHIGCASSAELVTFGMALTAAAVG